MTLNQDDILSGIWTALDSDSTLQLGSYLGGSGRIWKGPLRPTGKNHPIITVEGVRDIDHYIQLELWEITISIYSDTLDNGTADNARLGRISQRMTEILSGMAYTVNGGQVFNVHEVGERDEFDVASKEASISKLLFLMYAKEN